MAHSLNDPPPLSLRDRLAGVLIADGYGVADSYDAADAALRELDRHRTTELPVVADTAKLPPLGETVRRRPPVPPAAVVRELSGPELLRALAGEIERELAEEEQP